MDRYYQTTGAVRESDFELLTAELNRFPNAATSTHTSTKWGLGWWCREVMDVFHVDLFAHDFDRQRGISVIEPTEKLTFVLYTLERGMEHLPHVLEAATGKKPITIPVVNTAADKSFFKPYRNHSEIDKLYKRVRRSVKFPAPLLEEIYHHPVSRFFYDDEQIAGFIEWWREPA